MILLNIFVILGFLHILLADPNYIYGSEMKPSLQDGATYNFQSPVQMNSICLSSDFWYPNGTAPVLMSPCNNGGVKQEWILRSVVNKGTYQIVEKSSGKCLNAGKTTDEKLQDLQIHLLKCETPVNSNQLWTINFHTKFSPETEQFPTGKPYYIPYIVEADGRCISYQWGQRGEVYLSECSEHAENQWFHFDLALPSPPPPPQEEEERTLIIIKPEVVQRGLIGEIITRFERKGFKLIAIKFMVADEDVLRTHYDFVANRAFFPGMMKYLAKGPLIPMVWEGKNCVKNGRIMLGNSSDEVGTIHGDFSLNMGFQMSIVHASHTVDLAKKEIQLWFEPQELIQWNRVLDPYMRE